MKSKLYFDTNIYDFIFKSGQTNQVHLFLQDEGYKVLASNTNLIELLNVPDLKTRKNLINTLRTISSSHEQSPMSWIQTKEILCEIRRCRPYWINNTNYGQIHQQNCLKNYDLWGNIDNLISQNESTFSDFKNDFEKGINRLSGAQRNLKEIFKQQNSIYLFPFHNDSSISFEDPNIFWRAELFFIWYNAIVLKLPESRDYSDWISPFLTGLAFRDPSNWSFWFKEVFPEKLKHNMISSLVDYYQIKHKVTHGNSQDQMHAPYILDCDRFFTADRDFCNILTEIVKHHFPHKSLPLFVDRSSANALNAISSVLHQKR